MCDFHLKDDVWPTALYLASKETTVEPSCEAGLLHNLDFNAPSKVLENIQMDLAVNLQKKA